MGKNQEELEVHERLQSYDCYEQGYIGGICLLVGMLHWISRLFRRDRVGKQDEGAMLYVKGSL